MDNPNLPDTEVVEHGEANGIRWYVTRMESVGDRGTQYNGYAELPEYHPILIMGNSYSVGDHYLNAHGGITYAKGNIVGFDTNHYRDTEERWPLRAVVLETRDLAAQIAATNNQVERDKARRMSAIKDQIKALKSELEDDFGLSPYIIDYV